MDAKHRFIPEFLGHQHNLSVAENKNSRISGMHTKSLSDAQHRFQNFRNIHSISVGGKTPISAFLGRAELLYGQKIPIPDILEH